MASRNSFALQPLTRPMDKQNIVAMTAAVTPREKMDERRESFIEKIITNFLEL
jgi:hypothetical protein